MAIPATDNTKWVLDWSPITKDSFGNPVRFTRLDRVLIGFYQGRTAADLQTNFKDIEISRDHAVRGVGRRPAPATSKLGDAKLRGGTTPFPGFTQTDGVWAIGRHVQQVSGPRARWLMTILQPQ